MKVVIVTGVSSGIGLATANYFAQKGNHVYGISRSRFSDKNIKHIQADVTDLDAIKQAYQDIFEIEGSIDILINNAGIGIQVVSKIRQVLMPKHYLISILWVFFTLQKLHYL